MLTVWSSIYHFSPLWQGKSCLKIRGRTCKWKVTVLCTSFCLDLHFGTNIEIEINMNCPFFFVFVTYLYFIYRGWGGSTTYNEGKCIHKTHLYRHWLRVSTLWDVCKGRGHTDFLFFKTFIDHKQLNPPPPQTMPNSARYTVASNKLSQSLLRLQSCQEV